MKILHICLSDPFHEGFSYQVNNFVINQARNGDAVTVIAGVDTFDQSGKLYNAQECDKTIYGSVRLIRVRRTNMLLRKISNIFKPFSSKQVMEYMEGIKPDLIIVHNPIGSITSLCVISYKKKYPECVIVGDNHTDYYNTGNIPRRFPASLLMIIQKQLNRKLAESMECIYGVTPTCIEYAETRFGIPRNKLRLLPLGYDQERVKHLSEGNVRSSLRKQIGASEDDTVIIHGGKLTREKRTKEIIEAYHGLNNPMVKLVIFGGVSEDYRSELEESLKMEGVLYLGVLKPEQYYAYYLASDFALFPGSQSVLWQEALGCGLPLVVSELHDVSYLQQAGALYTIHAKKPTSVEIKEAIQSMLQSDHLKAMREETEQKKHIFAYSNIVKQIEWDAFQSK